MWWDERRPGGRLKSLLFLVHPGPSLLVTATFVAVSALAGGGAPSALDVLQLVLVMLPVQFAIGIVNDLCDREADAVAKPFKPLARGVIRPRVALAAAVVLAAVGLLAAASIRPVLVPLVAGGLAAGLAYDLGLGRTQLSLLPWWAAFALLPVAAFVAAGRTVPWAPVLVPLSGLLALSLHLANGLPDIAADRAAGSRSLAVWVGEGWGRRVALVALAAAAVVVVQVAGVLHQRFPLVLAGSVVALLAVTLAAWLETRQLFPLLAPAGAVLAVTWLAALPDS
jgi:4-hydroxybenzoate polyprenyltransferase